MKYVIVNCFDRHMYKIGVTDNPKEASEMLKDDFVSVLLDNGYTEEEIDNDVCRGEEWDLSMTEAWFNASSRDYDWIILEV